LQQMNSPEETAQWRGVHPRASRRSTALAVRRKKERKKELRVKKVVADEGGGGRGEIQTKGRVRMQPF
jgi:hypothetical protein